MSRTMREYYHRKLNKAIRFVKPSMVLKNQIGDIRDIQTELTKLAGKAKTDDRLMITYYNHLWEPILKLASWIGWRKQIDEQNWLDNDDIINLLNLSGWEMVSQQKRLLLPIEIPLISDFINSMIAPLPLVNSLCLMTLVVARKKEVKRKEYSVSIVVAARKEEENI